MPLSALALVILAALLDATWNIAAKRAPLQAGGDDRFVFISAALTSVLWLPAGLWFSWLCAEACEIE